MTRPRSQLIVLERTPFYHCIARCVRRAYLCGQDEQSGQDFEHRKDWVIARLRLLAEVFAIDIAAYAIMSNHYHLVLHVDKERSERWDRNEVVRRWLMLHKGPALAQRYHQGEVLSQAEMDMLDQTVCIWRERLSSISCFMARMNEYIARRANEEDGCKGHFWEARFVSRGLVDLPALLSCMAYVDLNPIRAGVSDQLHNSEFASIQQRLQEIEYLQKSPGRRAKVQKLRPVRPVLMAFKAKGQGDLTQAHLPFNLKDYIELVDLSGRVARTGKGQIGPSLSKALEDLALDEREWLLLSLEVQKRSFIMLKALEIISSLKRGKNKNIS